MEWRDLFGYEGIYQVSEQGDVKSLDRFLKKGNNKTPTFFKGKILKQQLDNNGYLYVHLSYKGKSKKIKVHRLVCEAFHVRLEEKNIVNHINGNKTDNNYSNLEWCSHSENTIHALKIGLMKNVGINARDAILSEEDVVGIRKDTELSYTNLAVKFGVSRSTIADIKQNRSWKFLGFQTEYTGCKLDVEVFLSQLEHRRKILKLNFSEFSKLIGVSHSTFNRWKRREIVPRRNTILQISEKLSLDVNTFLQNQKE